MAYHFSANQFEDKYSPRKLGNWEYPKWYPSRPRQRLKSTKIIADDNGHLLDGIKRENAWGNYVGTWDLPRRITREYIKQLVAPPERLVKCWEKKNQQLNRVEKVQAQAQDRDEEGKLRECSPIVTEPFDRQTSCEQRNNTSSLNFLAPTQSLVETEQLPRIEEKEENNNTKYGCMDEKIKNILDSVEETGTSGSSKREICKETKAFPRHSKEKTVLSSPLQTLSRNEDKSDKYLKYLNEHLNKYEEVSDDLQCEKKKNIDLMIFEKREKKAKNELSSNANTTDSEEKREQPPMNGYPGNRIAKKFHDENLRHKPLPDVIDDSVYKALTCGRHPHPGSMLSVRAVPSAIGWKSYAVPGPTECSKLNIYRPKTAVDKVKRGKDERPKTCNVKDHSAKKRFLPIDLAICWDLKPDDPSEEPKRSPHIDGSNGSAAPAVFTMIQPKECHLEEQSIPQASQAMAEKVPRGFKDENATNLPSEIKGKLPSYLCSPINKEAVNTCINSTKPALYTPDSSINSISANTAEFASENPKTAWTSEDSSKALTAKLVQLYRENGKSSNLDVGRANRCESHRNVSQICLKKRHQSTPNLPAVCQGSGCRIRKNETTTTSSKVGCSSTKYNYSTTNMPIDKLKIEPDEKFKNIKNEQKARNCSACDKSSSISNENHEKAEFKAAFKAGMLNSESSHSGSTAAAKSYKVPKMRLPFAKKSYSIGTLVPPFSFSPESKGQEYPEHWRLTSVYKHSYKPINTRKRPLLASLYL